MDYVILGRVLKKAREESNRTQKEMANLLGVTASNISSWESGKSKIDIETYVKVCSVYQIDSRIPLEKASDVLIVSSFPSYGSHVDEFDKRIVDSYLNLGVLQRKVIKDYFLNFAIALLDDGTLENYREQYIEENAGAVAARDGQAEKIDELKDLYDQRNGEEE